ncbi:amino acid ABC transporter permease [Priestia abyssalis]|uniref:amino acid ABC transporter permease n=1 Tax=Priestia abyssalis TaxID=1221450 RepID=UPI001EECBD7A|nr:ABC transporter permease subunit [Priestia abyssalis]
MNSGFTLDWSYAIDALPILLEGVKFTILISIAGILIGFLIAIVVGIGRTAKNKAVFSLATLYVEIIRGTPIMVQALYIYFAIPLILGTKIDPLVAGIGTIAINASAYIAEIIRGSIQSVDRGQVEAGRSLGLSRLKTFYYIVWPQAFKNMLPSLGNQFIISLKDTSLLTAIGVGELTRQGTIVVSSNFRAVEIYTMVALLYLIMTVTISLVLRFVERRLNVQ